MERRFLIGFDIGGTKSSVILAAESGEIVDRATGPTEVAEGPEATLARLSSDARRLMAEHSISKDHVLGVGISCGGPLDSRAGIVYSPPNLPGWDAVPVVRIVEEALGLPVYLENDADCCALAEFYFGAGRGKKNIIAFTWGTGIGAGIVLGGRLYSGSAGLAGEIGHITYVRGGRRCQCGKLGCIEAYASGSSIGRIAREEVSAGRVSSLSTVASVDAQSVCEAARAGDELSREVIRQAAQAMGHAVAIAAHTLNPEVIALGTLAVKAPDLLMPELMRVVECEVWERIREKLVIVPSLLGDRVQDLSAISAVLGRLTSDA